MKTVERNKDLICWSKLCLVEDEWVAMILAICIAALFLTPILYYTFIR